MATPVVPYAHDCKKCISIGHICDTNNHQLDLYICPKVNGDFSVVIRFGEDVADYWSLPVFLERMVAEIEGGK